jgi:hypothetical protein
LLAILIGLSFLLMLVTSKLFLLFTFMVFIAVHMLIVGTLLAVDVLILNFVKDKSLWWLWQLFITILVGIIYGSRVYYAIFPEPGSVY